MMKDLETEKKIAVLIDAGDTQYARIITWPTEAVCILCSCASDSGSLKDK